MDRADRTCTAATLQQGILRGSESLPAEPALVLGFVVVLVRTHDGMLNFLELFEKLVIWLVKNTVRTVAALLLWRSALLVDIHVGSVGSVADLLYGELHSADLQNIFFLDFVVLSTKAGQ